uniref:AraC family carnitine catabolism transcriptional activator n=1 Tax=Aestuariispira insulae TaxID=1461337 RepID=A0A3D9HV89_9PROT|nr:GlxA family transcriptional regulator [Aestuariispira insulae]RED53349.1 AraC family carnitine catabolism transcriptional activator [Aestuariispira insulae]
MMFGDKPTTGPQHLSFLLLHRFSLMAFASASEPLRIANWLAGETLYEWELLSADGQPVMASNGMQAVTDRSIDEVEKTSIIHVCTSFAPEDVATKPVLSWLRKQASHGAVIGAMDTGSHILACAGLLDGYSATIHWMHQESFSESFPHVNLVPDLFVIDRDRVTSSGGTSSMDVTLQLIRAQHGKDLAVAVADTFVHNRIREGDAPQRMNLSQRLATNNRYVVKAVELMESHLEDPLRTSDISSMLNISLRELERAFQKSLKSTPGGYYRRLRLERARSLLQQTEMSVLEVAISCGFTSSAHFSRCYRERYGHPPSIDRRI